MAYSFQNLNYEIISRYVINLWVSQVVLGEESATSAGDVKRRVPSLGREGPLEDGMGIHSSVLAWRSHGQRGRMAYCP